VLHCLEWGDWRFWEDKLGLGDNCYELAVGVGPASARQWFGARGCRGCSFAKRVSRALWRGAEEVGVVLSIVAVPLPSFRFAAFREHPACLQTP